MGNYWSSVRPVIVDMKGKLQYKYAVFSKLEQKFVRWESFEGNRSLTLDRACRCAYQRLSPALLGIPL